MPPRIGLLWAVACTAIACGDGGAADSARGPDERSDFVSEGTCRSGAVDFCGGLAPAGCGCDAECADAGDCCIDANPVCGVPSNRLWDRTAGLEPLLDPDSVEIVAALSHPPGNVTVSPDGRIFFTIHPESTPKGPVLWELTSAGPEPFPPGDDDFQDGADSILSVRIDSLNRLWALDYGDAGLVNQRLIAIDLATNEVVVDYRFPKLDNLGSNLNDFQISPDAQTIYIADQAVVSQDQAIIVVDVSGPRPTSRRVLENHPSVDNGPYDLFVNDVLLKAFGFIRPKYGVDSIALDQAGEFLYYAALNGGVLHRVPTSVLRDVSASDDDIGARVEKVADITLSDGIATDAAGHVYITSFEHSAITRVAPGGPLELVVRHPLLRWPDGLAWAPDGSLLVTASALHTYLPEIIKSEKDIARHAPYHILRIHPQDACDSNADCTGRPGH